MADTGHFIHTRDFHPDPSGSHTKPQVLVPDDVDLSQPASEDETVQPHSFEDLDDDIGAAEQFDRQLFDDEHAAPTPVNAPNVTSTTDTDAGPAPTAAARHDTPQAPCMGGSTAQPTIQNPKSKQKRYKFTDRFQPGDLIDVQYPDAAYPATVLKVTSKHLEVEFPTLGPDGNKVTTILYPKHQDLIALYIPPAPTSVFETIANVVDCGLRASGNATRACFTALTCMPTALAAATAAYACMHSPSHRSVTGSTVAAILMAATASVTAEPQSDAYRHVRDYYDQHALAAGLDPLAGLHQSDLGPMPFSRSQHTRYASDYRIAADAEIAGLRKDGVFHEVSYSSIRGKSATQQWDVIPCQMIVKAKLDNHNKITKFKGRAACGGNRCKPGLNYTQTSAAVPSAAAVRTFFAICTGKGYNIRQFDVERAFLNVDLPHGRKIAVVPPTGYREYLFSDGTKRQTKRTTVSEAT
jgi:hypothetical protein